MFKYSFTKVANPLTHRVLFPFESAIDNLSFLGVISVLSRRSSAMIFLPSLILLRSMSTRLESRKLMKLQLKQLLRMYKS